MSYSRIPLRDAPIGVPLKVVEFDCGREAQCRLIGLGIIPGSRLVITSKFSSNGPFSVIVNGSKVVVGRGLLNRIFVVVDDEISLRVGIVGLEGAGKRRLLEALCEKVEEVHREDYLSPILRGVKIWKGQRIEIEVLPSILGDFPLSIKEEAGFALALEGGYDRLVVLGKEETLEKDLLLVQYLIEFGKQVILAIDGNVETVNFKILEELCSVKVVHISIERRYGLETLFIEGRDGYNKTRMIPQLEGYVEDCIREIIAWLSNENCSLIYPLSAIVRKLLETPQDTEFFFKREDVRKELYNVMQRYSHNCEQILGEPVAKHIFERRTSLIKGVVTSSLRSERIRRNIHNTKDGLVFLVGLFLFTLALMSLIRYPLISIISFLTQCPTGSWQYLLGLIAVLLGFVPAVFMFFLLFYFLYESNYIYRIAFELDGLLHLFGLHGGALVPIIAGLGCSIPAVEIADRLLSGRDRISVLLSLPFSNCMGVLLVFSVVCAVAFSPLMAAMVMWILVVASIFYTLSVASVIRFILGAQTLAPPDPMYFPEVKVVPLGAVFANALRGIGLYLRKVFIFILPVIAILWFGYRWINPDNLFLLNKIGGPIGLMDSQVVSLLVGLVAKELVLVSQFLFSPRPVILQGIDSWKWLLLALFLYPGCLPVYIKLSRILDRRLVWTSFLFGVLGAYILITVLRYIGGWM